MTISKCGDELATTTLDNGNEATVIAGTPNPHLSIRKAMGCVIARSYFVKAFVALSTEDQNALIAEHDLKDFAILTAYVVNDFAGRGGRAYHEADSIEDAQTFVTSIAERVVAIIGETDDANRAYAEELDAHYTNVWEAVVDADRAADRASKRANMSDEDRMVAELMEMLRDII